MEQRRELMKENYCLPSRYWEPGAEEEYKEENDADNYDGDGDHSDEKMMEKTAK